MHNSGPKEYILLGIIMVSLILAGMIFQELGYIVFFQDIEPVEKTNVANTFSIVEEVEAVKGDIKKEPELFSYIEIINSCETDFSGECVLARTGPGTDFEIINRLRSGVVLKVEDVVTNDLGERWYKITFDEWLRYPERVPGGWYVYADNAKLFEDEGVKELDVENFSTSTKHILVDRSEQKLYAYDGEELFMEVSISSGLLATPTPRGTFTIYKKTPSRYMQGPITGISSKYFDLPGVPWNLYFTEQGAVIHGAYWHKSFGSQYSNGCVNLSPENARKLYDWADVGMEVVVRE